MIQLTLTLKMTTAQVVETSVTVNNNSPIQDYVHPDDQTQPTFEMTPGFKPFTKPLLFSNPKPMATLVNYTCKSFINIESVCQINLIRRCSQMSPATIDPGYEKPLQRVA